MWPLQSPTFFMSTLTIRRPTGIKICRIACLWFTYNDWSEREVNKGGLNKFSNNDTMENGKKKAVVGNNLTDSNVEIYHRKLKRTHFMKKSFYVVYKFYCYFALFWSRMKGKEKYDIIKYNIKCVDFMINIMCPLGYKLSTIIEYRNLDICINGLKIILPDRLKCDSTVEDIYNMLGRIPKSDALKLLRKISPDLLASERLAYFSNHEQSDRYPQGHLHIRLLA